MKRLILALAVLALGGLASAAMAGDYHVGTNLVCTDCHVAHYSQTHTYGDGRIEVPLGTGGPFEDLLRNDPNDLCLTCHNNNSAAPDVFGDNTGIQSGQVRRAGALNAAPGHLANDAGYLGTNGHTLWSTDVAPGGTYTNADGLECVNCHSQHGSATQYRNLLNRGTQTGKNLTYAKTANDLTKDIFEHTPLSYTDADVDYNEPTTTASAYGAWCASCHTNFHGAGGAPNMGGQSGGVTSTNTNPWVRHPTADVNIGESGASATFISSLTQFNSHTNRVKVMDSQGLWNGTTADNTVTPSCMSCHKAHGNRNPFGLIFMTGSGATVTEDGDGGQYRDLCRQCHTEGA